MLAKNAIRKKHYYGPDDKDDCYQTGTGVMSMFTNWHSFNPEKFSNAFAYFTEVFTRGIAEGFNQVHSIRGLKKGERVRTGSISSANKGQGMFNI